MVKRLLSALLAVCMVMPMLPLSAQALTTGGKDNEFLESVISSSVVPDGYIGIYTAADLVNADWKDDNRYILMADLNMNDAFGTWTPVAFRGTLDGNGHIIKNLHISVEGGTQDSYLYGLFSSFGGTVKNLALSDINIDISGDFSDYVYIGGLAGETARFGATIENCYVSGRIGANTNLTSDIYRVDVGGLVGTISGSPTTILSCANFSTISVDSSGTPEAVSVGGLIGSEGTWADTVTVSRSINSGNITADGNGLFCIGGISGTVRKGNISCCKNAGVISVNSETGTVDIGGIVGWSDGSGSSCIFQCGNSGEISGTGRALSGTYGGSGAGGILGGNHYQSSVSIEDAYNSGDISLEDTYRGLSGYASKAGGAGGVIGQAQHNINMKRCYNYGAITSNALSNDVIISNGGVVGFAKTSNIQNCYWRSDTADIIGLSRETSTVSESGTLSVLNANYQNAYVGFDFNSVWTMGTKDYALPILMWETESAPVDPTLNADNVFIKQSNDKTCTLATAAMMVRRRAMLDGINNWDSITEAEMKKVAWGRDGFIEGFTYRGITGGTYSIRNISAENKKTELISMLQQHPEGIGVYSYMPGGVHRHAVLLTDYDAAADTFYCADPAGSRYGRIPLDQCTITWGGAGQANVLNVLHRIYYVAKDVNRKTLVSTRISSYCPVDMIFSIDGAVLDSRTVTGTSTNSFGSITVSGTDDDKNIEVQITGDYVINHDAEVKLIGVGDGTMTFVVEHFFSDGSTERNTFEHVSVSDAFTAETTGCYPQSSVVLSISSPSKEDVWVANPNETATGSYVNFDNPNPDTPENPAEYTMGPNNELAWSLSGRTVTVTGPVSADCPLFAASYDGTGKLLDLTAVTSSGGSAGLSAGMASCKLIWLDGNHAPWCENAIIPLT